MKRLVAASAAHEWVAEVWGGVLSLSQHWLFLSCTSSLQGKEKEKGFFISHIKPLLLSHASCSHGKGRAETGSFFPLQATHMGKMMLGLLSQVSSLLGKEKANGGGASLFPT